MTRSNDQRFWAQFSSDGLVKFKPYSKHPPCYKDITFWIPAAFHENSFYDLVRNVAGDLVGAILVNVHWEVDSVSEDVKVVDRFKRPADGRESFCFRINYRSMDRNLTNEEIN